MAWRKDGVDEMILKVLVGSRAHDLHTEVSDYDYRGVFVQPTREILSPWVENRTTSWVEGRDPKESGKKEDDTAWEIGHFLFLAMKCNPSVLEVFRSPRAAATEEGLALQQLFPAIWNPKGVAEAFIGYGVNQRKKMLEEKDGRPHKYACAYLRALIQAEQLLRMGVLLISTKYHPEYHTLLMFKNGCATVGAIVDKCREWQYRVEDAAEVCKHVPDLKAVEDFLIKVREAH